MNLFGVMDISASALLAERQRAEIVASNLANSETSGTANGNVYKRQEIVFGSTPLPFHEVLSSAADRQAEGVQVLAVQSDPAPPIRRYDPGNPNADAQGYVSFPNISPVAEMTDLMEAVRSYQLNVSAVQATKNMLQQSISLLR